MDLSYPRQLKVSACPGRFVGRLRGNRYRELVLDVTWVAGKNVERTDRSPSK